WSLYLGYNQVKDLSPISELPWLSSLELTRNGLEKVDALKTVRDLRYLDIRGNKITDLKPLLEAAEKDKAGDQRFAPFLRLYQEGNPFSEDGKKTTEALKKTGVRIEG
ncbi:MAG: leucine-rich repeat domain-containing protein, partial [Verrucomicrobiota bacterium]